MEAKEIKSLLKFSSNKKHCYQECLDFSMNEWDKAEQHGEEGIEKPE